MIPALQPSRLWMKGLENIPRLSVVEWEGKCAFARCCTKNGLKNNGGEKGNFHRSYDVCINRSPALADLVEMTFGGGGGEGIAGTMITQDSHVSRKQQLLESPPLYA